MLHPEEWKYKTKNLTFPSVLVLENRHEQELSQAQKNASWHKVILMQFKQNLIFSSSMVWMFKQTMWNDSDFFNVPKCAKSSSAWFQTMKLLCFLFARMDWKELHHWWYWAHYVYFLEQLYEG